MYASPEYALENVVKCHRPPRYPRQSQLPPYSASQIPATSYPPQPSAHIFESYRIDRHESLDRQSLHSVPGSERMGGGGFPIKLVSCAMPTHGSFLVATIQCMIGLTEVDTDADITA